MADTSFHNTLKKQIHLYTLIAYQQTREYPEEEQFSLVPQDRQASIGVMTNYIQGTGHEEPLKKIHSYETASMLLRESIYCRYLAKELGYITDEEYHEAFALKKAISHMLKKKIEHCKNETNMKRI